MAVAFDATANTSGNGNPITFSHTCTGANRLLLVLIAEHYASAVTGVTYNSIPMTLLPGAYNDPGINTVTCKIFYLVAPATGSNTVSVSQSAVHNMVITAISFTGVDQSNPLGSPVNSNNPSSTSMSDNVSSVAGNFVVDHACVDEDVAGTRTVTVGAGQTQRSNVEFVSGVGITGCSSTESGAATNTMSWTIDVASAWVHTAVEVKASGSDTTPPANPAVTAIGSPLGSAIGISIVMPPDTDLSQYEVRRLTTDFPLNDRTDGTVIVSPTSTTPSAVVNITDSGRTNGERCFYRVFCKDTTGNWNAGTTATEVAAVAPTVVGWRDLAGTLHADGETGSHPIFEWTIDDTMVEVSKPVPFRIAIGTTNPGANTKPGGVVSEYTSDDQTTFLANQFRYFNGSTFVTMPTTGVPWATVDAGPVTCRFYSELNADQDLYGSVRVEQSAG